MRTLIPGGLRQARAEYWVPIKHYDLNVVMRHYGTTCQHCLTLLDKESIVYIKAKESLLIMKEANIAYMSDNGDNFLPRLKGNSEIIF